MYHGFEYNLNLLIDYYQSKLKFYLILLVCLFFLFVFVLLENSFYTNKFVTIFLIIYFMIALKTYVNIYYNIKLTYMLDYYQDDIEHFETKLRKKLFKLQNSLIKVNSRLYTFYLILYTNIKSKQ